MKESAEVVILGGGVIGCALAYQLGKRGIEVIVLEKDYIGAQASNAASGMLAPLKPFAKPDDPYTALLLSSLARFPELVSELEAQSGISLEYRQTGTLRMMKAQQLPRLQRWVATWNQAGYKLELLKEGEIRQCEPACSPEISVALYHPHDPQLNAAQLVLAYARAAERCGARICTHEAAVALSHHGTRIEGVRTNQSRQIACQHLVLATGAWARPCAQWLSLSLPVRPVRGQSMLLRQPRRPIEHILFGEGGYLAPRQNGTILVGTARDEAGFDTQTTPEGQERLSTTASKLVPALSGSPIERAWAGLLPVTPDARPILGSVPSWENLTLACGYNGYGLLLSARTSQMLTHQISTGHVSEQLRPFSLERFPTGTP